MTGDVYHIANELAEVLLPLVEGADEAFVKRFAGGLLILGTRILLNSHGPKAAAYVVAELLAEIEDKVN